MSGDLKSIVLHELKMTAVSSDFDVPIGMRVSGVDSSTYSLTGAAYSTVVPPQTSTNAARVLQADEVALAYEFAKKFPGVRRVRRSNAARGTPRHIRLHDCLC